MNDGFFLEGEASDEAYVHCRDSRHKQEVREALNRMWERCHPFVGDTDFREKATREFRSCTWHLYLLDVLLEHGFQVEPTGTAGPDILLTVAGKRVWIEAICIEPGDTVDGVEEPPNGQVYSPDDLKIILRHTAGIKKKMETHRRYVERGYVDPSDIYLIALNAGAIPDADESWDDLVSYMEQSVFGLGDEQWHVSVETGNVTGMSHEVRLSVNKPSNQAPVSTAAFLGTQYSGVSGLLYSALPLTVTRSMRGADISLVCNPNANNRMPLGVFRFGREKWVEENSLKMRKWVD